MLQAVLVRANSAEEVGYWMEKYLECGCAYALDGDKNFIQKNKDYPTLLYFPFTDEKSYGQFVRKAAIEGAVVKEIFTNE